jgi:hypothetical protein
MYNNILLNISIAISISYSYFYRGKRGRWGVGRRLRKDWIVIKLLMSQANKRVDQFDLPLWNLSFHTTLCKPKKMVAYRLQIDVILSQF